MFIILTQTLIFTLIIILLLWLYSILINDVSIIDIAFAPLVLTITLVSIYLSNSSLVFQVLIFFIIFIWSLRLTLLMMKRKIGYGEDVRYTKLREWKEPGISFNLFVLKQVFLLQGVVIWFVTLPIQLSLSISNTDQFNIFNNIGLIIIILGFFWEVIGDYQLNEFKKDPSNKDKFLKDGLWSLSRHPNYFGEILFWWGIFIFSIVNYKSLIAVLGPMIFTYLIMNVTGVKTLDKRMVKNYKGYRDYINKTNAIIPKFF